MKRRMGGAPLSGGIQAFWLHTLYTHTHACTRARMHTHTRTHTHTLIFPKSLPGGTGEKLCAPCSKINTTKTVTTRALGSCAWSIWSGLQGSGPTRWADSLS